MFDIQDRDIMITTGSILAKDYISNNMKIESYMKTSLVKSTSARRRKFFRQFADFPRV